ncbi:MAG: SO2930 family diheme c-type cytochrome, partial [Pseudomonadota bacterium]
MSNSLKWITGTDLHERPVSGIQHKPYMKTPLTYLLLFTGLLLAGCETGEAIVIPEKPYEKLSDYNFFQGALAELEPNERVLPYDLNSPLFSDYAHKARFVWMPEGTGAQYTTGQVLDFPEQSVLIKNFYFNNDETDPAKGHNRIETRLLINRGDEWEAVGYIWNEDRTDAFREVIGDIQEVSWVDKQGVAQTINYIIPNKNQCKSCHLLGKTQVPIGPKVRNLNKPYPYVDGEMNQLEKWAAMGYLKGYDADAMHPKTAVWEDESSGSLHERALAYLDINCGHCHNPDGSANTSGLHLVATADTDMSLGIYKATVSAGAGTGGHTYSIVPGQPDESIMIYRMRSTDPAAMMPEVGRTIIHQEGIALIREWIETLEVDEALQPATTRLQ